eukprot:6902886-Prorocentrum_lima.AAC.1
MVLADQDPTPGVKFKWPGRFEPAPGVDVLGGVFHSGIGGIDSPEVLTSGTILVATAIPGIVLSAPPDV